MTKYETRETRHDTRIGVFGGSFDPIHLGHLVSAERAVESLALDRLYFIPTAVTPLKRDRRLAPARDRLAMIRAAIRGNPRFAVSDLEVRRGGVSYTVDTLRALRRRHPGGRFHLLIGSDSIPLLPLWREIGEIARLATFVVAWRPTQRKRRVPIGSMQVRYLDSPLVDISSTAVRERTRRGLSIRYLVPQAVEGYIRSKGLYRT